MASEHDLTTIQGLRTYLIAQGERPDVIKSLSGGSANYVYRTTYLNINEVGIYRYAAPYLSSNKDFLFDSARVHIEAAILKAIPDVERDSASNARAVKLVGFDKRLGLLRLEDAGNRNLKQAYSDASLDIREIAFDLAKWLAHLHSSTLITTIKVPELDLHLGEDGNNHVGVKTCRYSYENLHTALVAYGEDPLLAIHINEYFGSLLDIDDECICHGDFWPGNVVVGPEPNNQEPDIRPYLPNLTIIDWEMSRRGNSATDVGQFAAEAFLLDSFDGDRGLRVHFLNGYALARRWATRDKHEEHIEPIGRKWIKRMTVHFAVHIAFWPTRVPWTNEEKTGQLVKVGVSMLKLSLGSNWEGLRKSFLFKGLSNDWEEAFLRE
jgi:hypothetical protein